MLNPLPVSSAARDIFDEILGETPKLGLTCRKPGDSGAIERLKKLSDLELLGGQAVDLDMVRGVRAGLLLRAERFEELQEWELRSLLGHCARGALQTPGSLRRLP